MGDEGYIKFRSERIPGPPIEQTHVEDLLAVRKKLFEAKLIGSDSDGVGYGNISKRVIGSCQFYITGTQTGGLVELHPEHVARVLTADVGQNVLRWSGSVNASSESLTHWATYEVDPSINAVIHAHHELLWQYLIRGGMPTTDRLIPYGTPELGREVQRLYTHGGAGGGKIIAMGGHKDGVLSFGGSADEAYNVLMFWYMRAMDSLTSRLASKGPPDRAP